MALPCPGAVLHLHVYSWLRQVGQPSPLRASARPPAWLGLATVVLTRPSALCRRFDPFVTLIAPPLRILLLRDLLDVALGFLPALGVIDGS